MGQIIFVEADGTSATAEFKTGESLMKSGVNQGIAGIVAECGGACSCSTCHVILSEADFARFAPPGETEESLLDFVADGRRPTSRLSCQLVLDETHDGMVVQLPASQF